MPNPVHFLSGSEEWSTPQDLFDELDAVFHFDLDACASSENAKCQRYFTKADDALRQSWCGTVWMNPPYGRKIGSFMKKAYESSREGATVVCLVPSRTDTHWWHDYAAKGTAVFLTGRLRFGGASCGAPFPSAIVIFWGGRLGGTRPQSRRPRCLNARRASRGHPALAVHTGNQDRPASSSPPR